MAFEQKDNSGIIFKNDRKESPSHPDYTGNCRIEGHDYWISCWVKDGRSGKFFSLAFKRKDGAATRPDAKAVAMASQAPARRDLDDEVPFAPEVR